MTSAYKVAAVARDNFDRTSPSVDHLRQGVKEGCGIYCIRHFNVDGSGQKVCTKTHIPLST